MHRSTPRRLSEILDEAFERQQLTDTLLEQEALQLWGKIVGTGMNRFTLGRSVQDGVLTIRLSSATVRAELHMSRTSLVQYLNKQLGKDVIKDIKYI